MNFIISEGYILSLYQEYRDIKLDRTINGSQCIEEKLLEGIH